MKLVKRQIEPERKIKATMICTGDNMTSDPVPIYSSDVSVTVFEFFNC